MTSQIPTVEAFTDQTIAQAFTTAQLRNIRKVREFLAGLPAIKLKMVEFATHKGVAVQASVVGKRFNKTHFRKVGCGTAGCIAGWGAVALGCLDKCIVPDTMGGERFDDEVMSAKLGISDMIPGNIFNGLWPTVIVRKYALCTRGTSSSQVNLTAFDELPAKVRKAALLDVLDYMLLTGREPRLTNDGSDVVI